MRDASRIGGGQHPRSTAVIKPQGLILPAAKRVQRSRRKGSVMPQGSVYVGRPTIWGNPFQARNCGHAKSVILHDRWLRGHLGALSLEHMGFCPAEVEALYRLRERVLVSIHQLAGKDLACWCPTTSRWCHAELLLKLAAHYAEIERHAA